MRTLWERLAATFLFYEDGIPIGSRIRSFLFLIVLLLAGIVAVGKSRAGGAEPDLVSWFLADIDGDLKEELLVIMDSGEEGTLRLDTGERYGHTVRIYSDYEMINEEPVLKGDPEEVFDLSEIKPMKVLAGDINGDGEAELAVCVYKTTKFHPVMAKRPFFYKAEAGELEPVWLGSRLARPFADYILSDVDHDAVDEIVSIEFLEDGGQVFAVYDWKGFGFEVKAVSGKLAGTACFLNHIHGKQDGILAEVGGESYRLRLDGDTIKLEKA